MSGIGDSKCCAMKITGKARNLERKSSKTVRAARVLVHLAWRRAMPHHAENIRVIAIEAGMDFANPQNVRGCIDTNEMMES
ncbi:MAG: hypothetical protein Q7U14_01865 [Lacisediminimonas sp.]|nr:hypothetical protein [Lacisediminimonas sp.]